MKKKKKMGKKSFQARIVLNTAAVLFHTHFFYEVANFITFLPA